jgi:hypothetical protein
MRQTRITMTRKMAGSRMLTTWQITRFSRFANLWYGGKHPGKPRVLTPSIGGAGVDRQKCAEIAAQGFCLSRPD